MEKRVKGWQDLRRDLRVIDDDPNAGGWLDIWFNPRSGEIKCVDEGKGDELGTGFEKLDLDNSKFFDYSNNSRVEYIKYTVARDYPDYAGSVGYS